MRICVINSLYKPYTRGGAESIVAKQVDGLREQGHEVFVISTNIKRQDIIETIDNVKVYRLAPRNLFSFYTYNSKPLLLRLWWLKLDLLNVLIAYKVEKIVKQEKPDVVYTHNLRGLSYFILHILKVLKFKNIHTLHDIQYVYPSGLLIHGQEKKWYNTFFLRKWYKAWCRYWLGSPSQVIAPSQWLMDFYTRRGFFKDSEKVVKRPHVTLSLSKGAMVRPAHHDNESLKLVYIGQIEKHKGILWAVDTLKKSQLAIPNFQLDIYGTGSEVKQLENIIKDDSRFEYHGEIAHDKVGEAFAQADITLVPSLTYENAPTVIFESLQAGTPVLASRIGGIPEIINDNNGWLFEPGNENEFINKIIQL